MASLCIPLALRAAGARLSPLKGGVSSNRNEHCREAFAPHGFRGTTQRPKGT